MAQGAAARDKGAGGGEAARRKAQQRGGKVREVGSDLSCTCARGRGVRAWTKRVRQNPKAPRRGVAAQAQARCGTRLFPRAI